MELERYCGGVCINFVVPLGATLSFSFNSLFSAVPLGTSEQSAVFCLLEKRILLFPWGSPKVLLKSEN